MFRRFFDEGLAQSSSLLACERTRQAFIVDSRRDIDGYVLAAEAQRLAITHAVDTHIHSELVSGGERGARVVSAPSADLGVTYDQRLSIGELELTLLHTPGHSMCEGDFRSSLAASLLERHGMADVVNVVDGMNACRALEPTDT